MQGRRRRHLPRPRRLLPEPFLYGEGADLADTEAETITVTSPEAVTGIEIAQGMVTDGTAVKPASNDRYANMKTAFKERRSRMIINGPWEAVASATNPFGGNENLGVAPVPAAGPVRPYPSAATTRSV